MLKMTHYEIDGCRENLRAVFLSDFHNHSLQYGKNDLLKVIEELKPAFVLCGGDILTAKAGRVKTDHAKELMNRLADTYPVYACMGNHELRLRTNRSVYKDEWDEYQAELDAAGVHSLDNRNESLTIGRQTFRIAGFTLPDEAYDRIGRKKPDSAEIAGVLGNEGEDGEYSILLAHHPDYLKIYSEAKADLVLSGHVHGGMVRLPLLGGAIGATYIPFPKYDHGSFTEGGTRMIISAGLGSHTIPIRFNNPPELVVLDFRRS